MAEPEKAPRRPARKARCAIYTRKSSEEEGLEQAFNSLDAQREACAAFILSQKHGESDRQVRMITDREIAIRGIAQGRGLDVKVRDITGPSKGLTTITASSATTPTSGSRTGR